MSDGGTEGRMDGGTEGRMDGGTEAEGRRDGGGAIQLWLGVAPKNRIFKFW